MSDAFIIYVSNTPEKGRGGWEAAVYEHVPGGDAGELLAEDARDTPVQAVQAAFEQIGLWPFPR